MSFPTKRYSFFKESLWSLLKSPLTRDISQGGQIFGIKGVPHIQDETYMWRQGKSKARFIPLNYTPLIEDLYNVDLPEYLVQSVCK